MTKEEKIEEAYTELGLPFIENVIYDNGWLRIKPSQYSSKYEKLDILKLSNHVHSIRPKSLQGIENNNGWIKIESEADLPTDMNMNYYFYDYKCHERIVALKIIIKAVSCSDIKQLYRTGICTHYKPIEKPKPPIY